MSIFGSIIKESNQNFGLGDKSENLLSSLLSLITDQSQGGFAGFLGRFRSVGLGDAVDSWMSKGDNVTISGEQVESALGTETTTEMARQAGLDVETTQTALGGMIPRVVDHLTPDGKIPTENDLLSRIGGSLSGIDGATISTTGVMESPMIDRFGSAAAEEIRQPHPIDLIGEEIEEFNDDSPMKWIFPLIILVLLVITGWAFCGNSGA